MPICRVLRKLTRGSAVIEPDQLVDIDWLSPENIDRLVAVGAVARLHGPPLEELPGWKRRSQRLAPIGITTAAEFLEADGDLVATHLRVKPATVAKWKTEVTQWLMPAAKAKRRG